MSESPPSSDSTSSLDWKNALLTPLKLFAPWLAAVVVVSLAGYSGVVCVTPLAWLLALRVGNVCVLRSASPNASQRLAEAGLGGAVLGFLQGFLFWIVVPYMGPIRPDEQVNAALLGAAMIGLGIVAGAVLALFTGYLMERKLRTQS